MLEQIENIMTDYENHIRLLKSMKNIILEGPPGTGKTFALKGIADGFENLGGDGRGEFATTLHPITSYEDFVEGLRPKINQKIGELKYSKPWILPLPFENNESVGLKVEQLNETEYQCTIIGNNAGRFTHITMADFLEGQRNGVVFLVKKDMRNGDVLKPINEWDTNDKRIRVDRKLCPRAVNGSNLERFESLTGCVPLPGSHSRRTDPSVPQSYIDNHCEFIEMSPPSLSDFSWWKSANRSMQLDINMDRIAYLAEGEESIPWVGFDFRMSEGKYTVTQLSINDVKRWHALLENDENKEFNGSRKGWMKEVTEDTMYQTITTNLEAIEIIDTTDENIQTMPLTKITAVSTLINEKASFAVKDGFFLRCCKKAMLEPEKSFILLLDEINRCNIPKVLGDLMTTLETSKRLPWNSTEEAWDYREGTSVTLPYSERIFSVPENLYVVGTMNTTDRSVAPLDSALRRRFGFMRIGPMESNGIRGAIDSEELEGSITTWLKLNVKLKKTLGADAQIGHSYFFDADEQISQVKKDAEDEGIDADEETIFTIIEDLWGYSLLPQLAELLDTTGDAKTVFDEISWSEEESTPMFTKYGHQLKKEELDYTAFQRTTIIPKPEESVFLQQRQDSALSTYTSLLSGIPRLGKKPKLWKLCDEIEIVYTTATTISDLTEKLLEHERIFTETEMDEILNRDE